MELIIDLNRRHNQTFVIVTHAPEIAARCHRIVHMKDGQIVREEIPPGARVMNELFGLSMTIIMIVLLGLLGAGAGHRRLGGAAQPRDVLHRRAQHPAAARADDAIIIGLMLSTLIIATAFSIGDTVDYSITNRLRAAAQHRRDWCRRKAEIQRRHASNGGSLISALTDDAGRGRQLRRRHQAAPTASTAPSASCAARRRRERGEGPDRADGRAVRRRSRAARRLPQRHRDAGRPRGLARRPGARTRSTRTSRRPTSSTSRRATRSSSSSTTSRRTFTVKEIVKDRAAHGRRLRHPAGLPRRAGARAAALRTRRARSTSIAVSNDGGVRDGIDGSEGRDRRLNTTVFLGKTRRGVARPSATSSIRPPRRRASSRRSSSCSGSSPSPPACCSSSSSSSCSPQSGRWRWAWCAPSARSAATSCRCSSPKAWSTTSAPRPSAARSASASAVIMVRIMARALRGPRPADRRST